MTCPRCGNERSRHTTKQDWSGAFAILSHTEQRQLLIRRAIHAKPIAAKTDSLMLVAATKRPIGLGKKEHQLRRGAYSCSRFFWVEMKGQLYTLSTEKCRVEICAPQGAGFWWFCCFGLVLKKCIHSTELGKRPCIHATILAHKSGFLPSKRDGVKAATTRLIFFGSLFRKHPSVCCASSLAICIQFHFFASKPRLSYFVARRV